MDVGFFFCLRNVPFLLLLCSLTLHDTLLTTRGRRAFFAMVSNAFDTL